MNSQTKYQVQCFTWSQFKNTIQHKSQTRFHKQTVTKIPLFHVEHNTNKILRHTQSEPTHTSDWFHVELNANHALHYTPSSKTPAN